MEQQLLEQILENQKILLAENQKLTKKLEELQLDTQIIQSMLTEPMEFKGTARRNLSQHGGHVVTRDYLNSLKIET